MNDFQILHFKLKLEFGITDNRDNTKLEIYDFTKYNFDSKIDKSDEIIESKQEDSFTIFNKTKLMSNGNLRYINSNLATPIQSNCQIK